MMNQHRTQPRPGPACAAVAPLLALVVGQKHLNRQDASTLQAHLEMCAYCQSELDSYRRLDEALARHFTPPDSDLLSPGEISAIIDQTAHPPARLSARPVRPASGRARRPLAPPAEPPRRRGHALISALSALAAVVLIAAVGLALFISHASQPGGAPTPATTPGIRYFPQANDTLSSVYMVSASDGWAVGSRFSSAGIKEDSNLLHPNQGHGVGGRLAGGGIRKALILQKKGQKAPDLVVGG